MTARPPIAQFGDAIEVKVTRDDRAAAWPFRPSCYKDSGDTKTNWMLGLYDRSAPQIAAFARHRTSTALPLAHPAAPQGDEGLVQALKASLARRSVAMMDPPWTAAFNAALDMVARDVEPFLAPATSQGEDTFADASIDWRKLAKLAGDLGIRYRTNTALVQFLNAAAALAPAAIASGRGEGE